MKRFILIQFIILLTGCFLIHTDVKAIGLGFYADLPVHEGSGDNLAKNDYERFSYDTDDENNSLGFVLDTALASNSLFNYRLNLGYGDWKWKTKAGGRLKLDAYTVDNTFGFSMFRNKHVRLWIGPQLRFCVLEGKYIDRFGDQDADWKYSYVGFGFAPVIGLNYNPGDFFTASITMGYRFMKYYGDDDYRGNNRYYDSGYEAKYENDEKQFFMNISFFFRINDKF